MRISTSLRRPDHGKNSQEAHLIFDRLVPAWAELFLKKNAKYKDVDQSLGPRGVFPDINRKVGILKARVWNRSNTSGILPEGEEPTEEVIYDLIGHLFLMLALLVQEREFQKVSEINHVPPTGRRHTSWCELLPTHSGRCMRDEDDEEDEGL